MRLKYSHTLESLLTLCFGQNYFGDSAKTECEFRQYKQINHT